MIIWYILAVIAPLERGLRLVVPIKGTVYRRLAVIAPLERGLRPDPLFKSDFIISARSNRHA